MPDKKPMMKDTSILMDAIRNAGKGMVKVEKIEEPPKEKGKGNDAIVMSYYKPSLYISDKDLSTVKEFKAGDKVYLAIEATVKSVNSSERQEDGKTIARTEASVEIDSFADITDFKAKGK